MLKNIHPLAREGFSLFDQRKFYDAHEPLEQAWMETLEPERTLYQGVLQVGLAYYQISRGNFRGALKMFKRGNKNLDKLNDTFLGVDIRQLQKDARYVEKEIRDLGENRMDDLSLDLLKPVPILD